MHGINTARTVEVWMDEYKRLFYMNRPDLLQAKIGKLDNRNALKEQLQGKSLVVSKQLLSGRLRELNSISALVASFRYLDNVFPQKFVLDDPDHVFGYGRVRNPESSMCFDIMQG